MAVTDQILNVGRGGFNYNNLMSTTSNLAGSVGSVIKKVKSLKNNEISISAIRDYTTHGFLAQESQYVPDFFARMFDEPTYLSFRIEFMFDDPENISRNTAYNNEGVLSSSFATMNYGVMYDYLPEPFLDGYSVRGYKDSSFGKSYSTETYLDANLGDHVRASMLYNFKRALRDIQDNFPYYFTQITGIDSLTKVNPEGGLRLKDAEIELHCMEGLDLKITQLIQLYRKIVWDDVYQKWILPDMMRYFGMRIYISELRLFSDVKKESDDYPETFDFSDPNVRNMTYRKTKKDLLNKIGGVLNKTASVSQSFLGTKNIISKAVNYTAGTFSTATNVYNSIAGALNAIEYCNNAINEVMPTICFECHMCEFDISNTMSYMSQLSSSRKNNPDVKPTLKIKIGQVKEKQVYPLNSTLIAKENGYAKTMSDYETLLTLDDPWYDTENFNGMGELRERVGFLGSNINDELLTKTQPSNILTNRIANMRNDIRHTTGDSDAITINVRRLDKNIIDRYEDMDYNPNNMPDSLAKASLISTAMNEATALASALGSEKSDVAKNIFGAKSTATFVDRGDRKIINAVGDALNAAVDRIYNGPEMKSMAAQGVSEEERARIANNSFAAYINTLESSTATQNPILKEILKNYRVIQNS